MLASKVSAFEKRPVTKFLTIPPELRIPGYRCNRGPAGFLPVRQSDRSKSESDEKRPGRRNRGSQYDPELRYDLQPEFRNP